MADKILMNKNSLAALKVELKEYIGALPVFEMKEQKLKEVVQAVENSIARLEESIDATTAETKDWVAVMAERNVSLSDYVEVEDIKTKSREVAGVTIHEFVDIKFKDQEVDVFSTPLWLDAAIDVVTDQKTREVLLKIEKNKLEALQEELAEARRMKNALKEVFIPDTKENIRKIEIYLGDVERLAIGCAKLVKKKKEDKRQEV